MNRPETSTPQPANSNTFRSKLRTTLTVVAIFIGAFTLTITSAIGTGVSDSITTQVSSIGADNVMTVTKAADATSSTSTGPKRYDPTASSASVSGTTRPGASAALTASDITKIGTIGDVTNVSPSVQVSPDCIQYGSNAKYVLGVNANSAMTKADLAAGAQLDNSTSGNQVMLPTTDTSTVGFSSAKAAIGKTASIGITDYAGTQREIGLMKAIDMGGGRIYALFSIEAVFIGFLGSAIGVIFGIGIGSVISNALSRALLSGLPGLHLLQFAPSSIASHSSPGRFRPVMPPSRTRSTHCGTSSGRPDDRTVV